MFLGRFAEAKLTLISEAKRRANQANARRSTGPRSPEGKAAVRLNAVRHGLAGATAVLPDEDAAEFQTLLECLERRHAPQDESERAEMRRLAEAMWRQRRAAPLEAVTLQAVIELEEAGALTADDVLAIPQHMLRIARYEGRIARAQDRAQERLAALKAERAARAAPAARGASAIERPPLSPASPPKAAPARPRNSQFPAQLGFVSPELPWPAPGWPAVRPQRAPPALRRSP